VNEVLDEGLRHAGRATCALAGRKGRIRPAFPGCYPGYFRMSLRDRGLGAAAGAGRKARGCRALQRLRQPGRGRASREAFGVRCIPPLWCRPPSM
jgi:hypothetical protein